MENAFPIRTRMTSPWHDRPHRWVFPWNIGRIHRTTKDAQCLRMQGSCDVGQQAVGIRCAMIVVHEVEGLPGVTA